MEKKKCRMNKEKMKWMKKKEVKMSKIMMNTVKMKCMKMGLIHKEINKNFIVIFVLKMKKKINLKHKMKEVSLSLKQIKKYKINLI
jgi:hypothetical protein